MRKLNFYILDIEPKENAFKYYEKFHNSLINARNNKFYFNSNFNSSIEEISCNYSKLKINQNLNKLINEILIKSYHEAKSISKENMGDELRKGSLKGGIIDVLNKYSYYDKNNNKDIFDLVADIFTRILMGHYLSNGNKRLSLTFLKGILWHFGYYLKWTKGMWLNYTTHKTKIEEFVQNLESGNGIDNQLVKKQIKEWIMDNVIIGLNWRGF